MELGREDKIVYRELSYRIMGVVFDVYNKIGGRHYENIIKDAIAIGFDALGIKYKRELKAPVLYQGRKISYYLFDFLVEDKIILEIKQGAKFKKQDFAQVEAYLEANKLKLGILAIYTNSIVKYKRILNLY